jgi:hypothetical protein
MSRWIFIWAVSGLLLAGGAYVFAPAHDLHPFRQVITIFPWAALWASLVAHAPVSLTMRRVQHVTIAAILALLMTAGAGTVAQAAGRLSPLSTRMFVLAGLAAAVFAAFGTIHAICATVGCQRRRRASTLPPSLAEMV